MLRPKRENNEPWQETEAVLDVAAICRLDFNSTNVQFRHDGVSHRGVFQSKTTAPGRLPSGWHRSA